MPELEKRHLKVSLLLFYRVQCRIAKRSIQGAPMTRKKEQTERGSRGGDTTELANAALNACNNPYIEDFCRTYGLAFQTFMGWHTGRRKEATEAAKTYLKLIARFPKEVERMNQVMEYERLQKTLYPKQ